MDISLEHKDIKKDSYWEDLVSGNTGQYKEKQIYSLINNHYPKNIDSLLDIGVGTCELILRLQKKYHASNATCLDYDEAIIKKMKKVHENKSLQWIVADIFDLSKITKTFDLILLLDMIHEVYSFYGRPKRDLSIPINHELGISHTKKALKNISELVSPGGGLIITDNILCSENHTITVRCKHEKVTQATHYFFEHYTTKRMDYKWRDNTHFEINSQHFCTVLTQYNKIKQDNWDRWAIEKFETHQYMTKEDYEDIFSALGFATYFIINTPTVNEEEYNTDFEIIEGLNKIPEKRVNLLAIKHH